MAPHLPVARHPTPPKPGPCREAAPVQPEPHQPLQPQGLGLVSLGLAWIPQAGGGARQCFYAEI